MACSKAGTESAERCCRHRCVTSLNSRSTGLGPEPLVGVQWMWNRGRSASHWPTAAVFVDRIVVHDQVNLQAGRCGGFNQCQELDPFLMAVARVKRIDNLSAVHIHRRKQI